MILTSDQFLTASDPSDKMQQVTISSDRLFTISKQQATKVLDHLPAAV